MKSFVAGETKIVKIRLQIKKLRFWALTLFHPLYLGNGKSYVETVDTLPNVLTWFTDTDGRSWSKPWKGTYACLKQPTGQISWKKSKWFYTFPCLQGTDNGQTVITIGHPHLDSGPNEINTIFNNQFSTTEYHLFFLLVFYFRYIHSQLFCGVNLTDYLKCIGDDHQTRIVNPANISLHYFTPKPQTKADAKITRYTVWYQLCQSFQGDNWIHVCIAYC